MNISPFRNIILPSLLVSSAAFAALTLPVASTRASLITAKLPVPVQHWISPAISEQRKGLSIRYIGVAILTSTILGISTAEVLRSKQVGDNRRQTLLTQALIKSPNPDPAADAAGLPLRSAPAWDSALELDAPQDDTPTAQGFPYLDWESLQSPSPKATGGNASAGTKALLPAGTYRTCQIQTASHQRLTAICIDGEFFSFYRLSQNLDKTRAILERMARSGQNAVATPVEDGYALWRHQPGAELATNDWQLPLTLASRVTS